MFLVLGVMAYSRLSRPPKRGHVQIQDEAPSPPPAHSQEKSSDQPAAKQDPKELPETVTIPGPSPTQVPTKALFNEDSHLPRGPDDLKEKDFINKFKDHEISSLLEQKPLHHFPAVVTGSLFIGNDAAIIATDRQGEIEFRRSIGQINDNGLKTQSCVSIRGSDKVPIVATFADGTLSIRDGPVANSFLLSISEKHYFLIYSDLVAWEEIRNHIPQEPSSDPGAPGVMLYYLRGPDQKITYQGRRVRSETGDPIGRFYYDDFCRYAFDQKE